MILLSGAKGKCLLAILEGMFIMEGFFFTATISRVFAGTNELSTIASYRCLVSWGIAQNTARKKISEEKISAVWERPSLFRLNRQVHIIINRTYNKILDRDWFSASLFVT